MSILVVVQRPDWSDTACHWGQHWMKEYVTKPAGEAGLEVSDLYADDAIRSKVLEACKRSNFTYFSGLGHGNATTFTGQRKGRIFWKGDEGTKAVSNGKHFNFLSCVFGKDGAKWMQEEGQAIGVHGYDQSFIFVIDRGDFPNGYAHPFFDSHATVDRELFKGATHGEAHQACLDRFEYWIENAAEVCQRYLAWNKEHKVFWGDPEAKILPGPYTLTVTSDGCCPITVDGLGTVEPGATEEFAVAYGTEVTLTADESDPCCELDGWEVDGSPVGGNPIKVVMDSDHTAVATCSELGPYNLAVTSDGCCPIRVDGLGTVAPGGTEEFAVACGAEVTLTADESDPCCKLDGWEVDGSPVGGNPIKVVMDSDHTAVAACSELGPYNLAVTSDGCCPITVDGLGTVAPGGTEEFAVACGAEVTLTADESDPCCKLDGWEVDGSPVGGNPIKVVMDSDHTAVATCSELGPYNLAVTSDGCCPITVDGLGTVAPGGTEEFAVACGAEVTLTADESDPCCKLDGWEVDGSPVGGNPIKVVMDSDHTAVATCSELGPYTLAVTSDGCCPIRVDGLGTVAPGGTEEFAVACGAEVTLTADESDPCCKLDGWEVDGSPVGGNPIKVVMDSDHTAVAACSEPGPYTLTVTSDGCCPITVDGLGTVEPGATEEFAVAYGTEVTLTADESDPCCKLDGWEVDGSPVGGNPIKVVMDSDHTAVATCSELGPYNLAVTSDGCCPITVDRLGTVEPGGSEGFAVACGAEVTLTADESDPCCKFDGWEVDGSPVGGNPIKVTMDSDHTAVATCSEPGRAPSLWEILIRWIRRLLRFLGFTQLRPKSTESLTLEVEKMSDDIEERLSRVEATLQEIKSSIDLTNKRIEDLGDALRNDISENRAEIRDIRGRLWWVMGILFSMWVTIILTILFRG